MAEASEAQAPALSSEAVTVEGAAPGRWLFVLHGIYGAGRNWGSVARRLVRERPEWGARLVDLRQHGASRGFAPPHTLEAAAADVARLAGEVGAAPAAILGHSFGGKVALRFAADAPPGLRQVWVVDSTPSAGEPRGAAWRLLDLLRAMPERFASRQEAVDTLRRAGLEEPVAVWMATNLERRDGELVWRFDADAMESLLRDFFRVDLWSVVESPPATVRLEFVKAEASGVLDESDGERIEAAGRANGRVRLHRIAGGHWLNADNPDAIVTLLVADL